MSHKGKRETTFDIYLKQQLYIKVTENSLIKILS